MHTLVNHLTIKPDSDWAEIARRFDSMGEMARNGHPDVLQAQLVRTGPDAAVMVASFTDEEAMKTFSSTVAGPWFGENLREYLAGPADRRTGEMLAGFVR